MGHAPADVWGYTPRQVAAFHHFAARRKRFEAAERLSINLLAARGDPKDVVERHRDLTRDG